MAPPKIPLKERFERLVRITPGCWFPIAATRPYPTMKVDGKAWTMSRVAYELYIGPTTGIIVRGAKAICHRCDDPRCVNPDHLFVGTYSDNMQDMHQKGRGNPPRGSIHHWAKLDEEKVRQILVDHRSQYVIAKDYGVDQSVISDIKTRKIWRHVHV